MPRQFSAHTHTHMLPIARQQALTDAVGKDAEHHQQGAGHTWQHHDVVKLPDHRHRAVEQLGAPPELPGHQAQAAAQQQQGGKPQQGQAQGKRKFPDVADGLEGSVVSGGSIVLATCKAVGWAVCCVLKARQGTVTSDAASCLDAL